MPTDFKDDTSCQYFSRELEDLFFPSWEPSALFLQPPFSIPLLSETNLVLEYCFRQKILKDKREKQARAKMCQAQIKLF